MRNSELWGGAFWLGIGGLRRLGRVATTWARPAERARPGFAFFWIGILMCALSLACHRPGLRRPAAPTLASLWDGTRWRKVLVVVGLLLVYGAASSAIGFIPCTLALLLVLMWFVDPVDWWLALSSPSSPPSASGPP